MRLQEQTAQITGASQGLGRVIALAQRIDAEIGVLDTIVAAAG